MKVLRILLISILFFTLNSCHHDREDEAISVQYRIIVDGPILAQVAYKAADGAITTVHSLAHVDIWHTTEFVDADFEAHLIATLVNDSNDHEPYKLSCFVEGELVSVKEGIVLPQTEKTEEIKYLAQN